MAGALAAGGHDFAFLHVKAVDDTGHDRDTVLKVRPYPTLPLLYPTPTLPMQNALCAGAGRP